MCQRIGSYILNNPICTSIWGIVRIILTFPVRGERTPEFYDLQLEQIILIGTIGLVFVVLFLSVIFTWITYSIVKKIKDYNAR